MASSSNERCGGGGMGVGRNICISKICSTRFQFWSNPPPLFLFGLCKNLLPGLWPGSTSVQWRRRRRNWGKGLPLTRTHQQLVDLLRRVIRIHSFPLFLFCFFLKVWWFWHSSGLSSLYSFLSFQDYFLWGNPFRPQTVLWTLEHEEGGR